VQVMSVDEDTANNLVQNIQLLKGEVSRLHAQLRAAQMEHKEKMVQYAEEERHIREENLRLQRKLQMEIERREQLCRHLSESESSLEMDDERHFNEMTKNQDKVVQSASGARPRTVSSPIPLQHSSAARPISPGVFAPSSPLRTSGMNFSALHGYPTSLPAAMSPVASFGFHGQARSLQATDKFIKPNAPPPTGYHPPTSVQYLQQVHASDHDGQSPDNIENKS